MNLVLIMIALAIFGALGLLVFTRLSPAWMARHGRLALGLLLVFVGLLLLFVRQLLLGAPLAMVGLLLIFGPARSWQGVGRSRSRSSGRTSRVRSRYIQMEMDHRSGDLRGDVIAGAHSGRQLSELSLEQLLELRLVCEREDPEGAALLDAYLDAVHPAWREAAGVGEAAATAAMSMDRAAALEVLGLDENASEDDIRDAHRRLMKKLHPDQGGSTYLATQINAAKETLLGETA